MILLAGAGGRLGREVGSILEQRRAPLRAMLRATTNSSRAAPSTTEIVIADLARPDDAKRACHGVATVISCVGASLDLRAFAKRASYPAVDDGYNRLLLAAAVEAGVEHFIYVSVYSTAELSRTAYVAAHERFAQRLQGSKLRTTIVRPTGFFHSYLEMLRMARRGRGIIVASGKARTNPIHERDVAELCVSALDTPHTVIDAGGPDTYSRREIQELAFQAVRRAPRLSHVPARMLGLAGRAIGPVQPRLGQLLEFAVVAATVDILAPPRGARHLLDYFMNRD